MDKNSTITLHTNNEIPILGLGTWKLTTDTEAAVSSALEIGYRLIDTSSDYGSQPGVGEAIKNSPIPRENIYLITKVEEDDDAYEATKAYLKEMDQDYADLMLIHRPPVQGTGEDLWKGLIRAKEEGFAKDIGVSNYSIEKIDKLIDASGEIPVVNQIEWSPFGYSDEMRKYCAENQIIIQAYSPLSRGKRFDDATLNAVAMKCNKSVAQILIRWNLQQGIIPLPKANKKEHLEENLNVFDFEISAEDMERLNGLNEGYSSFGSPLPYI